VAENAQATGYLPTATPDGPADRKITNEKFCWSSFLTVIDSVAENASAALARLQPSQAGQLKT
jgi:hypothetical protein